MKTNVALTALPEPLRRALHGLGYRRADVAIEACTSVALSSPAGFEGNRGFVAVVNLASGDVETSMGAWGGGNPYGNAETIDNTASVVPLVTNMAVIKGESGGRGTFATVYVGPQTMAPMLPSGDGPSKAEYLALKCHTDLKGGTYRREAMERHAVTTADVDACVGRGWLKRNAAGAVSVTTAGKNAERAGESKHGRFSL